MILLKAGAGRVIMCLVLIPLITKVYYSSKDINAKVITPLQMDIAPNLEFQKYWEWKVDYIAANGKTHVLRMKLLVQNMKMN